MVFPLVCCAYDKADAAARASANACNSPGQGLRSSGRRDVALGERRIERRLVKTVGAHGVADGLRRWAKAASTTRAMSSALGASASTRTEAPHPGPHRVARQNAVRTRRRNRSIRAARSVNLTIRQRAGEAHAIDAHNRRIHVRGGHKATRRHLKTARDLAIQGEFYCIGTVRLVLVTAAIRSNNSFRTITTACLRLGMVWKHCRMMVAATLYGRFATPAARAHRQEPRRLVPAGPRKARRPK